MPPVAGRGSRLGGDVPKPLFPVAGKPAILYSLEAFGPLVQRIAIVVSPESRAALTELCAGRPERIKFVVQPEPWGDWHAVKLAVDQLHLRRGHVIVAWSDLIVTSADIIRRTVDAHLEGDADLTFPTMFERDPYLAVLRDDEGKIVDVTFREEGRLSGNGYWEHDCSFFVFKAASLRDGLETLARRNSDAGGPGGIKFVHIIPQLASDRRIVLGLPLGVAGSFRGFNTREEAAQIAAWINHP